MQNEIRKIGKSSDGREMHYSAGIILSFKGKYLLLDRVNPPPGFACPGGHIDEGELPKNAALRELYEETGISISDASLIAEEEIPWNYCKSTGVHYWYLFKAEVIDEKFSFNINEAKSMNWYTVDEMKKLPIEEVWEYWFKKFKIL